MRVRSWRGFLRMWSDITGEKTSCWKNGTPFARITKRERARSRDEGRSERKLEDGEWKSLRDLAHSKWLKDRGNWILAFDRAASGLLIERLVSFGCLYRSFNICPLAISACCHLLPNHLSNPSFATLTLVRSIIRLSLIFITANQFWQQNYVPTKLLL